MLYNKNIAESVDINKLTNNLLNFITKPDFVAYRFSDRKTWSNTLAMRLWKMQCVAWTLGTPDDFRKVTEEGWIPIFENFIP